MRRYYIRTQRQGTHVGTEQVPELFDTRKAARVRADELQDRTPSCYGRLIVSEWRGPVRVQVGRCVFTFPAGTSADVIATTVQRAERVRAARPRALRIPEFGRGALAKALQSGDVRAVAS